MFAPGFEISSIQAVGVPRELASVVEGMAKGIAGTINAAAETFKTAAANLSESVTPKSIAAAVAPGGPVAGI